MRKLRATSLKRGVLIERIDAALEQAVQNCADPDTAPKQKRIVTAKIELVPNDTRSSVETVIKVEVKLAPPRPAETVLDLVYGRGGVAAVELQSPQLEMEEVQHDS